MLNTQMICIFQMKREEILIKENTEETSINRGLICKKIFSHIFIFIFYLFIYIFYFTYFAAECAYRFDSVTFLLRRAHFSGRGPNIYNIHLFIIQHLFI